MTMQRTGRINGQGAVFDLAESRYAVLPAESHLIQTDSGGVIGYRDSAGKAYELDWLPVPPTAKIVLDSAGFNGPLSRS